jgi:hypothetical protein
MVAAIEIHNKPQFAYRAESFSILALNAWELLAKARLAELRGPRCLFDYQHVLRRDGSPSKRKTVRLNRSGNPHTLGLPAVVGALQGAGASLPKNVVANIEALTEIRDNAVHFVHGSPSLASLALEVGNAAVQNSVRLGRDWFSLDLSPYNLCLLNLGLLGPARNTAGVVSSGDERNLLQYLQNLHSVDDEADSDFRVVVQIEILLTKVPKGSGPQATYVLSDEPNASPVVMSEESIRANFPWDFGELTNRLRARYSDFSQNGRFYQIREPMMTDKRYVHSRFLDPANQNGTKKEFYNPNILQEFDKHYLRPSVTSSPPAEP